MIYNVIYFVLGCFFIGSLGMAAANRKVDSSTRRSRWIKFSTYFIIVNTVIFIALAGRFYALSLFSLILTIGLYEMIRAFLKYGNILSRYRILLLCFMVYLAAGSGLILFLLNSNSQTIIYVYMTVSAFDGFSQITGQLLGKRKLSIKLSPNKTVEGALGGALASVIVAVMLVPLIEIAPSEAIFFGLLISLSGLTGDLAASWVKRYNKVKDYSRILPEHGGVLDRFDSFIFAAAAFYSVALFYRYWPFTLE